MFVFSVFRDSSKLTCPRRAAPPGRPEQLRRSPPEGPAAVEPPPSRHPQGVLAGQHGPDRDLLLTLFGQGKFVRFGTRFGKVFVV